MDGWMCSFGCVFGVRRRSPLCTENECCGVVFVSGFDVKAVGNFEECAKPVAKYGLA